MLRYGEFIKRGEEVALGYNDLRAICQNDVNIVEFSDLADISNYQELFRANPRVILFWETESANIGHYNALIYKRENRGYGREYVEYFDSYGKSIDEVFQIADYDYSLFKGVNPLHRILAGIEVNQSKTKFQSTNQQIATCGRYASLRVRMHRMSNAAFTQFLNSANIPSDQLVTSMTVLFSDVNNLIN